METATIDRAKQTNLIGLAERYTTLHRESVREHAGPCPRCGGNDRFHVTAEWFFCRACHPKRGDAIDFLRWLQPGTSFQEAVSALTGGQLPTVPQATPTEPKPSPREMPSNIASRIAAAQERLYGPEGKAAQDYLFGRGLEPHAWLTFRLGYDPAVAVPGTQGRQRAPAVAIPWYAKGKLCGVRYRFLEARNGHRQTAEYGSRFAGVLYGGHVVSRDNPGRTLLIVEGELNAMSCWQVAWETRLDVLSLGSESQSITPAMIAWAQRYQVVITWLDKRELAVKAAAALPKAGAFTSPNGRDANDLLQAGQLSQVLGAIRLRLCHTAEDRHGLYLDYQRALAGIQGGDVGAAWTFGEVARLVGGEVDLIEPEPGRWLLASGESRSWNA